MPKRQELRGGSLKAFETFGLSRCRYRREAKTGLQNIITILSTQQLSIWFGFGISGVGLRV